MIPKRIIWHHTGDSFNGQQLEKVDAYHKGLGFPQSSKGWYVGYHWFIEKSGAYIQTRRDDEIGAHTKGLNNESIGVCFAGNFDEEEPTQNQIWAAEALILDLLNQHNLTFNAIQPHRWHRDTDCPGKLLDDYWLTKVAMKAKLNILMYILKWIFLKKLPDPNYSIAESESHSADC